MEVVQTKQAIMKLNELLNHVQQMMEICQKNGISPSSIDVCYVPDVMLGTEMIVNKKWLTSTYLSARGGELLLFDAASWEQYQRALK